MENNYELKTIIEDHSSTITALKFAYEKGMKASRRLKLISCGADKAIIWRNVESEEEGLIKQQCKEFCKNKIFSMDIAEETGYIVTGHDKLLSLW